MVDRKYQKFCRLRMPSSSRICSIDKQREGESERKGRERGRIGDRERDVELPVIQDLASSMLKGIDVDLDGDVLLLYGLCCEL